MASETRSWIVHPMTGRAMAHATPAEARRTLAVTLAIEEAARRGPGKPLNLGGGAVKAGANRAPAPVLSLAPSFRQSCSTSSG